MITIICLCFAVFCSVIALVLAMYTGLQVRRNSRLVAENLARSKDLGTNHRDTAPCATFLAVTEILLVFPRFPDDRGTGMVVGWRLPVGVTLSQSLRRTYWGDAAKTLEMVPVIKPDGFLPPPTAEFQNWDGEPQWFRATITTEEAERIITVFPHFDEESHGGSEEVAKSRQEG